MLPFSSPEPSLGIKKAKLQWYPREPAEPGKRFRAALEALAYLIARAVGGWAMKQTGNGRAVVRCVRRFSQPFDLAALNAGFPPERPTDLPVELVVSDG